jgi:hypothetical protein
MSVWSAWFTAASERAPWVHAGSACRACVKGGVCAGGAALPYAAPSFWSTHEPGEHQVFYECISDHACPGGEYDAQTQAVTVRSQCAQGERNPPAMKSNQRLRERTTGTAL